MLCFANAKATFANQSILQPNIMSVILSRENATGYCRAPLALAVDSIRLESVIVAPFRREAATGITAYVEHPLPHVLHAW